MSTPPHTRMRRLAKLAVLLLIGLALNILVAWTFALRGPRSSGLTPHEQNANLRWVGVVPEDWIPRPTTIYGYRGIGWEWISRSGNDQTPHRPHHFEQITLRYGWPMPSCEFEVLEPPPNPTHPRPYLRGGFMVEFRSFIALLPLRPRPIPFALDSGFYAALAAVTFRSFTRLRQRLRNRRGRCPRCAYSLLYLPPTSPCPECGHTAAPR